MKVKAYTLLYKPTGELWKHEKRTVYDTETGLKMGFRSYTDYWGGLESSAQMSGQSNNWEDYKVLELRYEST